MNKLDPKGLEAEVVLPIQMQERYYGSEIQAMLDELNAARAQASEEQNAVVEALERAANIAADYDRSAFPGMEGVVNVTKKDIAHRIRKFAAAVRALKETPNA